MRKLRCETFPMTVIGYSYHCLHHSVEACHFSSRKYLTSRSRTKDVLFKTLPHLKTVKFWAFNDGALSICVFFDWTLTKRSVLSSPVIPHCEISSAFWISLNIFSPTGWAPMSTKIFDSEMCRLPMKRSNVNDPGLWNRREPGSTILHVYNLQPNN